MMIIAGMRNMSRPNMMRHASVAVTPSTAGRWRLLSIHCCMNTVVNRAVMAKSIPVESNVSSVPIHPPRKEPSSHALIEQRHEQPVVADIDAFRTVVPAEHGIRFIAQGIIKVALALSLAAVSAYHRYAEKHMPCGYHEGGKACHKNGTAAEHRHADELRGAAENDYSGKQRPDRAVTMRLHQYAVSGAQHQKGHYYGQ